MRKKDRREALHHAFTIIALVGLWSLIMGELLEAIYRTVLAALK